jgi:hypothetical protein
VAKRPQSQQRRNRSGPLLSELIEGGAVTYEPPFYVKRRGVVRLGGNSRGLTWKLEVDPIARLRELVERFEASSRMVSPLERWASGLIAGLEEAVLRYEPGRRVPRGPYAKPSLRTARVFLQPRLAVARSLADLELRKPPAKHKATHSPGSVRADTCVARVRELERRRAHSPPCRLARASPMASAMGEREIW